MQIWQSFRCKKSFFFCWRKIFSSPNSEVPADKFKIPCIRWLKASHYKNSKVQRTIIEKSQAVIKSKELQPYDERCQKKIWKSKFLYHTEVDFNKTVLRLLKPEFKKIELWDTTKYGKPIIIFSFILSNESTIVTFFFFFCLYLIFIIRIT